MDILQEWFESGEELQSTGLFCHDVSEHLPALGEYQTVILVHRSVPGELGRGLKSQTVALLNQPLSTTYHRYE